MHQNSELEVDCSINEMADKLRLSRPRFHQLRKLGVFPPPVYCPFTKRPFYPLDLQNRCLHIRNTGIGQNGKPVWFYSPRKKKNKQRLREAEGEDSEHFKRLSTSLKEFGIKVTIIQVKNALKELFPEGLPEDRDDSVIIANLFRYFKPERINDV